MKKVTFWPAKEVFGLETSANVISIMSPEDARSFACDHKRLLKLSFDDVDGFIGAQAFIAFNIVDAECILKFCEECGDEDVIVHCHAGMSRSAAVAKFLSEHLGYFLDLSKPCLGTTLYYNRHVYETLEAAKGGDMRAYYKELELSKIQ